MFEEKNMLPDPLVLYCRPAHSELAFFLSLVPTIGLPPLLIHKAEEVTLLMNGIFHILSVHIVTHASF